MSDKRKELLALLLAEEGIDTIVEEQEIRPAHRERDIPLSFAQQRLWFLYKLDPDNPSYNIPAVIRFQGPLNLPALEQSFNEVLRRHEALRTCFDVQQEGQPVQIIKPHLSSSLPVIELTATTREEWVELVEQYALAEVERPFDLSKAPLFRACLLRFDPEDHVLLLTMHHIIADGWSTGVMIQEVASFYKAFLDRTEPVLPPLSIQYADFSIWQREWLQGKALETQLDYWKKQLEDAPPRLELPTDRPRPPVQTYQGGAVYFQVNAELTEKLKHISQKFGVTLYMTLLSVFATLLSRYSSQQDIVIGSAIANRNRQEIEPLIGFFVNMLALRLDLSGNPAFSDLLKRVQRVTIDSFAHQDLPFEKLVDVLQPERNLNYQPFFQVAFSLENAPKTNFQLPGIDLAILQTERTTAKFDLTLAIEETETDLTCEFEYNRDLFDTDTIERMTQHFQSLLQAVVTTPEQKISCLPLLSAAERQQLLESWNDTQSDFPREQCVHQLFEAHATRAPEATAVTFADVSLTYQELNEQANQVAHYLRKLGVTTESFVGICMERSPEMVIGILGILKAGGVYVPLDPTYPRERLSFMLADTQASVLLVQEQLLDSLPNHQAHVIRIDTDWALIAQESRENPTLKMSAENLAYVMYTSGSTGRPKGIGIPHRGITRLVINSNYAEISPVDRVGFVSNSAFDAATFELWGALLNGATLVGIRQDTALSPPDLAAQIQADGITNLFLTTALFNQLVRETPTAFSTIKNLMFGGEAGDPNSARKLLQHAPPERLLNMYGPTESTTYTTGYLVENVPDGATTVPIGRPIANTQVYVLDRYLEPVPIGVPGELCIGGDGLARNYINRPELTAEKFIPNPFSDKPGTRLYKTGDLVRYLPDGNVEFLGRIDNQVKIRGFRIELAEIETVLSQHPTIHETVVVVRTDPSGNKHLVAYAVSHHKSMPSVREIKNYLEEKLPSYMVPTTFIFLEAFPLNPNGKVDRHKLPEPTPARSELTEAFVSPRTPVEQQLAEIWSTILGVAQVGIHDNFFELGGDSIISIQVVSRANQMGLQLNPKQLYQHQTIAKLATVATPAEPAQKNQELVTGPLPLTPIQHWFFEQKLPDPSHFNQSVLLEVASDFNPDLLNQAIEKIVAHHDALRMRFEPAETGWRQINDPPADKKVSFTRIDLSETPPAEFAATLHQTATQFQTGLNLANGPLMQVVLFQSGRQQSSRLLFIIHHLVVDGVSWRTLIEDILLAYQQLAQNQEIQLPSKTTSFKAWANRLVQYAQSETLSAELEYWRSERYADITPLPVDYVTTDNREATTAQVSVSLNEADTQALLREVPPVYNTRINDVLLAALVQTMSDWTDAETILIDLEGHGREQLFADVDLSRTVGWFTTIYPVLLTIESAYDAGDVLKSVKEQLWRIPHGGIGYGLLRYLHPDPTVSAALANLPQAQISFNYLGQFDVPSRPPILGLAPEPKGPDSSPSNTRRYLLEVNGVIVSDKLRLDWSYSQNIYRSSTIERLAQEYINNLKRLITHCQTIEFGGYTPSDFTDIELDQETLDQIVAEIDLIN